MKLLGIIGFLTLAFAVPAFGQKSSDDKKKTEKKTEQKSEQTKKVNFGYSTNPPIREAKVKPVVKTAEKGKVSAEKASKKGNEAAEMKGSGKKATVKDTTAKNTIAKADPAEGNTDTNSEFATKEKTDGSKPNTLNIDPEIPEVVGTESTDELTLAKKTREIARKAADSNLPPTEIYKVGIDDILFISLQADDTVSSTYYTVLNDGTVDYPLAGEMVYVVGLTTDEIEVLLREKIKLYENPEVSVKVREHASHKVTVSGLVEKTGEKYLQREAIPLFVIKAEAIVKPNANQVTVRRANLEPRTFSFSDKEHDDFLIYPGDIIEFGSTQVATTPKTGGFIYLGEFVRQFGRKEYYKDMTLTQAILASGGLRNSKIKKVVIRRKDEKGLLKSKNYKLRDIKKGKVPDPVLKPGDIIESS